MNFLFTINKLEKWLLSVKFPQTFWLIWTFNLTAQDFSCKQRDKRTAGAAAKNRHADLHVFLFSEKLIFETQRSQEPSRYFHSWFPLLKDAFC